MAPKLILLMSSGSKKKELRYACLIEAKASHSQRIWADVSSSAPHFLHSGLSDNPIRLRCLLKVLCPVRRPVTALDCVLLKDRNLALAPRERPRILTDYDMNSITMRPILNATFLPFHTQTFISASQLTLKFSADPLLITPNGPGLGPISPNVAWRQVMKWCDWTRINVFSSSSSPSPPPTTTTTTTTTTITTPAPPPPATISRPAMHFAIN